jgi:hypothetical protein
VVQIEARKEVLELFVNVHESISKIERMLHISAEEGRAVGPAVNVLMRYGLQSVIRTVTHNLTMLMTR